jgi:formyl-CoA transferase
MAMAESPSGNTQSAARPRRDRHRPLAGIRVLTVDNYFAGNYGPLLLAAHGAEVIKVEQPGSGDPLRKDSPYLDPETKGLPHGVLRLMRGKSSVALDIRKDPGKSVMRELLAKADVFWTNLRPQAARRIDLDPDTVRAANPDIIYASVSGFGLPGPKTGPFTDEPAFDIIIQALTGLMTRNADPDGTPQYSGLAIADQVTSLYTAFGVVMSLYARKLGMPAATVDVAMFDAMFALNEKTFSLFSMDGVVRPPRISATNSPFGAYRGKDGYLVIGVGGNILWERFCKAIGREDLLAREDLNTGVKRVQSEKAVIRPCIEAWLRNLTVQEASRILLSHDVPSSPILDVDSPIVHEQALLRGVAADLEVPGRKPLTLVQSPVRMWNEDPENLSMPPSLGEHTENILRGWLKMDDARIAALRKAGAIN